MDMKYKTQLFIRKSHIAMDNNDSALGLRLFFMAMKYTLTHYSSKKQPVL